MKYKINSTRQFIPIKFAILTVSDTRSKKDDKSGDTLEKLMQNDGHKIVKRQIIHDDREIIAKTLLEWSSDEKIEAIITTGGTGLLVGTVA